VDPQNRLQTEEVTIEGQKFINQKIPHVTHITIEVNQGEILVYFE
jgi:hypothetical protein